MTRLGCTHTDACSPTGNFRELLWQPFSNISVCRREAASVGSVCVCVGSGGYCRWFFSTGDANRWPHFTPMDAVSPRPKKSQHVIEGGMMLGGGWKRWGGVGRGGGVLRGMDNECDVWKTTRSISFISCLRRNLLSLSIFISHVGRAQSHFPLSPVSLCACVCAVCPRVNFSLNEGGVITHLSLFNSNQWSKENNCDLIGCIFFRIFTIKYKLYFMISCFFLCFFYPFFSDSEQNSNSFSFMHVKA